MVQSSQGRASLEGGPDKRDMVLARGLKWVLLTAVLVAFATFWAVRGLSTTDVLFTRQDLPRDDVFGGGRWFVPCGRDVRRVAVRRLTIRPLQASVPLGEPVGLVLEAETGGSHDDRLLVLQPVVAEVSFVVVDAAGHELRLVPHESPPDVPGPPAGDVARWLRWLQYEGVAGRDMAAPAFPSAGVYRITASLHNPFAPPASPLRHQAVVSNTVAVTVTPLPTLADAVRLRRLHHGHDLWRALNGSREGCGDLLRAMSHGRDRCYDQLLQYAMAVRTRPQPSARDEEASSACLAALRQHGPAWMQYELDTAWAMQGRPDPAVLQWYLERYPTARETANLSARTYALADWLGLPSLNELLTPPFDTGR